MASSVNLPAPIPGTLPAINETKANVEELAKLGLKDNTDYEQAAGMLKNIKHHQRKADELEEQEKRPHLDELTRIRKKWTDIKDGWNKAEKDVKAMMSKYIDDQRRAAAEAQAKLNEEAAKKRERMLKQAAKASDSGKHEQAALIADHASTVIAPVLQVEPPKVAGVSTRETWHFEVINDALVPAEYKVTDLKKLGKVVQTLKENAKMIAGIRVWKTTDIASTSEQPEV